MNIDALKAANSNRWRLMQVKLDLLPAVRNVANKLVQSVAKQQYQYVSAATSVPWYIIAVIHEREASQSWRANLAQGDPWDRVSIHVPKGRGPFRSWNDAAIDALVNCPPHAAHWTDWRIGGALTLLEQYNGLGYAAHGRPSPYIWASTNQYVSGKYIADGHYDPNAIDHQLGCAALLSTMAQIDASVTLHE